MIDTDMRVVVASAKPAFVATVGSDGAPNLSPKGSVWVYDGTHLAFMDIPSLGTVANFDPDPRIEIDVVGLLRRPGYRFTADCGTR